MGSRAGRHGSAVDCGIELWVSVTGSVTFSAVAGFGYANARDQVLGCSNRES